MTDHNISKFPSYICTEEGAVYDAEKPSLYIIVRNCVIKFSEVMCLDAVDFGKVWGFFH